MPPAQNTMRKLLPWLLLVCFAVLPPVLSADAVVEEIIARINNQIVTRTEYLRRLQTALRLPCHFAGEGNAARA